MVESSVDAATPDDGDPEAPDTTEAAAAAQDPETPQAPEGTEATEVAADPDAASEEPEEPEDSEEPEGSEGSEEPAGSRWWRGIRRIRVGTWIAAAVLALVLAGSGYEGWLLYQHHEREVAASQALDAAQKFILVFTTVEPNSIDKNFAAVLDGTTGEFREMYSRHSEELRQALVANKAEAHGTVIEAAVKSVSDDHRTVEVVLFIDQSVSNANSQGPQLDRSRLVITMQRVDGRWLASNLDAS